MYTFTVQCPITSKLFNLTCNNYNSANILEKQFVRNGINYQIHAEGV